MKDDNRTAIQSSGHKIGCQGWNYPDWITRAGGQNIFYPRGTKAIDMLGFYSRLFDTIEVDSTFYATPPASVLEDWYQKTPQGFTFSFKMPREISHFKKLTEASYEILEEFCERITLIREKLAAVLIQLAPQFEATKTNARNLRNFLTRLPRDVRFAIEFRNRNWMVDWTYRELRKYSVALCLVEGGWIPREIMFEAMKSPTADFTYTRFMGERDLSDFSRVRRPQDSILEIWHAEFAKLQTGPNFIYFSNFFEGFAPESSKKLRSLFKQETPEPETFETQKSLF